MRRKIRLKKKRKIKSKLNYLIILVSAIIIGISLVFKFVNKKVTPVIMKYAEIQTVKIATQVIGKAINNEVIDEINLDDLFIITNDTEGNTKTIDFNPIIVNKITGMISSNVQDYLKKLETGQVTDLGLSDVSSFANKKKLKKGVIYEIPSGIVFNNTLLTNIGPKIPVKLSLIGDVSTNFKTDITNYGINNALIELTITVEVTEQVILPFSTKQVSVKTEVPLALKLIQGAIPNYYSNGTTTPNVTITEK